MTKETIAFRALAAVTAGFFWLAIMRFLSSYDDQVEAQERTENNLIQLQQAHSVMIATHEARIDMIELRLQFLEKRLGITTAGGAKDEKEI